MEYDPKPCGSRTASMTPLDKDSSRTEEVSLPIGEPFTFSDLDWGWGRREYFLRLKFRTTKNQVTQTSGEIPEQSFLSVVPSSRGHFEMQLHSWLSQGTGVPGMQNILQWIEQSMLCQQHPHWQTLHNKLALVYSSRATEARGNRKDHFKLTAFEALPYESWAFVKHLPGNHMAQACSSTSTSRLIISKAWTGARLRPTSYLSNKTLGCILAQATGRHRAMPADSWTKHLRNVKQVSEGRKLWSLLIVAVISSVL